MTIIKSIFKPSTFYSIYLSLTTSLITTGLALLIGVPVAYALSRYDFPGKSIIELIINLPITLPPLIAGLSLLVFFYLPLGKFLESLGMKFVFTVPGIVLAQFIISASFAIITLKATFDEVDISNEIVARTLGCNKIQAFLKTTIPQSRYGLASAVVLTWSRAVGEFVPILLFVGAMKGKTDILPIAIFLKFETGDLDEAIALTIVFMMLCLAILPLARLLTRKQKAV
jgi:molybdate transport system permease protein